MYLHLVVLFFLIHLGKGSYNGVNENEIRNILMKRGSISNAILTTSKFLKIFSNLEPEVTMTVEELIRYYGYPVETHNVTTDDGYILEMLRIPHGRNQGSNVTPKIPIFLMHGVGVSAGVMVTSLINQSVAYIFADAGFDVWLGNARGSEFGRKHKSLSTKESKFWDFSFEEIGTYDLPAMWDYMLNSTGREYFYCIGHSMGGGVVLIALATHPKYYEKIKTVFTLAPLGNLENPQTLLSKLPLMYSLSSLIENRLFPYLNNLGIYSIYIPASINKIFYGNLVKFFEPITTPVLMYILGSDYAQFNRTRVPIQYAHVFLGITFKTIVHFKQLTQSEKFQHFDWGEKLNIVKYGQKTPPQYNLSRITIPTYVYYGTNDKLISKENFEYVYKNLGNRRDLVPIDGWNHMDFTNGMNAKPVLYDGIIDIINQTEHEGQRYSYM